MTAATPTVDLDVKTNLVVAVWESLAMADMRCFF